MDGERNIGNPDPFNKAVSLINQALDVLKNSSGDQQTSCQNTENTNSSLNSMLPSTLPTSTSSNSSGRATPKQCTPETSTQRPEPLELQRLFPFFGPRGTSGRMKSQRSSPYARYRPKETWTHTFICLSDIKDSIVPSREKKRLLKDGGLGEKKVVFNDKKGSFSHVKTTLEREFSQLQDLNGAFEILRSCGSRRLLEIIPIPPQGYTVPMLKEALGQAIGYVRPLQKNLKLKKTNQVKEDLDSTSAPSVPCMNCGQVIPIPSLREHEQDCGGGSSAMVQLHSEPDVSSDVDIELSTTECKSNEKTDEVSNTKLIDLTTDKKQNFELGKKSERIDDSCKLASILDMFPDKSYREVQKKFAETGSVEDTVSAFLDNDEDDTYPFKTGMQPPLTLSSFRNNWISSNCQPIVIDRQSSKLLRDIFKLHKKGIDIKAIPDVEFKGEDGTDASGPTREYFFLSMSLLATGDAAVHLFEGQTDHLMPIHCLESLDSMLFYYAGVMISHSFLHNGYPLVGVSRAVAAYIITGSIDEAIPFIDINDVPDYELRQLLEKIRDANTEEEFNELNENDTVIALLTASGFVNKLISSSNKDMALEAAILHYTLNIRKLEMDDIRRGMETISLVSFLNKNRELWHSVHVFPQTNQVDISVETLESKLVLHSSVKLDEINEREKQAFEWCKEYVRTLPERAEDEYSPTTGRFLQFVTGSPLCPTQPIYVKFNRVDKVLPDSDSCLGILSLHVNVVDFTEFKSKLDSTLSIQSTGYGRF